MLCTKVSRKSRINDTLSKGLHQFEKNQTMSWDKIGKRIYADVKTTTKSVSSKLLFVGDDVQSNFPIFSHKCLEKHLHDHSKCFLQTIKSIQPCIGIECYKILRFPKRCERKKHMFFSKCGLPTHVLPTFWYILSLTTSNSPSHHYQE